MPRACYLGLGRWARLLAVVETRQQDRSEALHRAALAVIPGGVNSPVRSWSAVGLNPRFVESARGTSIRDADGHSYTDYVASFGPLILGHADPVVVDAVVTAAAKGTSYGATTAAEVELAESLCRRFTSLERIRLVNSGTEATMSAIRLARAATGREGIVKFGGCYHGHADGLLVRAGSGATTLGVPDSPGVPASFADLTRVARFNDLDSLEAVCDKTTAAVIVEPVAGNMGVVPPRPGFLEGLCEMAAARGALVIFDEVISGLRLGPGGYQGLAGFTPDLTCLGKIIGGGLPVGAYGGRAELMDMLAPVGPVYQAGTLAGNPLAVAAGLATLRRLDELDPYDRLEDLGARLEDGIRAALADRGCVQRVGSMLTVFFGPSQVTNYDEATTADTQRFARFFRAALDQSLWIPPSQFESWFVSVVHSQADIDATVEAVERALLASD